MGSGNQHAKVTDPMRFNPPIRGLYKASGASQGEPCLILQNGNQEGSSPVGLIIDTNGQFAWVPLETLSSTDPNYLPTGVAVTTNIGRQTQRQ